MSDDNEIKLAPTTQFRLGGPDWTRIELWAGTADVRAGAMLDNPKLVGTLLQLRVATRRSAAIELLEAELGFSRERASNLLSELEGRGVIVAASAPNPYTSEAAARWIRWGWRDALDFHLAVRDLRFATGDAEGMAAQNNDFADRIDAAEAGDDLPSPGPYKDYPDAPFVELPRSRSQIDAATVGAALYKRRTCRKFTNRVIELPRFAELMQHVFSANEWPLGRMGMHLRRTTPSGGGRHPVEAYAVIRHVEGIPPGLYHYSVRRHGLEQIKAGDFGDTLCHLGHRQSGLDNVSAALFYTARWDRHIWKYRYARSYRMVMFDIAHLVQTTLVAATALDLRSFLTPALRDTEAAAFLGLDDLEESPIYVTSLG